MSRMFTGTMTALALNWSAAAEPSPSTIARIYSEGAKLCSLEEEKLVVYEGRILFCFSHDSFGTPENPRVLTEGEATANAFVFPRPISRSDLDRMRASVLIPDNTPWTAPPSPDMAACSQRVRKAKAGESVDCSDIYQ